MRPDHADVLIAGGGPGGSAAAIHFARHGLRVRLVDRARFPRDKACAEYLGPGALRELAGLGVLPALDADTGHTLTGTTLIGPRGARLTGLFARAGGSPFRPTGLSIARLRLDDTLVRAARAGGVEVLEGATLQDLLYDGGRVAGGVLRDETGTLRSIRARLVIGADGLRSTVARRLGTIRRGVPSRIAFVTHFSDVPGLGAEAEMHVGRAGYVGLNPIGGGVTNVALVVARRTAAAAKGDPAGFFHRMLETFPAVAGRVSRHAALGEVLVTGPFAARASRVTAPGALLVGDAAEFFDPFTGEGIHTALRGAALAAGTTAEELARDGVVGAGALQAYRAARHNAFAGQRAVERLIGWGMFFPALFDRALAKLSARDLGHTFLGATGDILPARAVLTPSFLLRMVL